jgi:hypothetical protein
MIHFITTKECYCADAPPTQLLFCDKFEGEKEDERKKSMFSLTFSLSEASGYAENWKVR